MSARKMALRYSAGDPEFELGIAHESSAAAVPLQVALGDKVGERTAQGPAADLEMRAKTWLGWQFRASRSVSQHDAGLGNHVSQALALGGNEGGKLLGRLGDR